MPALEIKEILDGNTYPGRGIIVGLSEDGRKSVAVYFIMGRSGNSRNRIFAETEDGIRTEAFDSAKLEDPSLIIYRPVRLVGSDMIIANGDQSDTVYEFIQSGKSFEDALNTQCYEPDAPHYTPRISAILRADGRYTISILKTCEGNPKCCCKFFFDYSSPVTGEGHFIHTYKCDGSPLESYSGEPKKVKISGNCRQYAQSVWNALDDENRVALYAASRDIASGKIESVIINKNH